MNWKTKVSELTDELVKSREELVSLSKEHEALKSELEAAIRKQKEAEKEAKKNAATNHYAANRSCRPSVPRDTFLDDTDYHRPMQSVSEAMHWIRSTNGHGRSDKERLDAMLTERARGNRCYINDHGELKFPDDCGF